MQMAGGRGEKENGPRGRRDEQPVPSSERATSRETGTTNTQSQLTSTNVHQTTYMYICMYTVFCTYSAYNSTRITLAFAWRTARYQSQTGAANGKTAAGRACKGGQAQRSCSLLKPTGYLWMYSAATRAVPFLAAWGP